MLRLAFATIARFSHGTAHDLKCETDSLLIKAGIQSRRREHTRDNGTCPRQEAEIANGSPAGSRCHTCSTAC